MARRPKNQPVKTATPEPVAPEVAAPEVAQSIQEDATTPEVAAPTTTLEELSAKIATYYAGNGWSHHAASAANVAFEGISAGKVVLQMARRPHVIVLDAPAKDSADSVRAYAATASFAWNDR